MNKDKYFFDKRQRKRSFIKYLIIFGIGLVPTVLFNIYVGKYLSSGLVIFLDCIFLLIIAFIGNLIAQKIYAKSDEKLQKKIQLREEINAQKNQILDASYKSIRKKKKIEKNEIESKNNSNGESE